MLWFIIKIFGLHPCFPWNFLSDGNQKGVFCYFNEVTFVQIPRMGAGCQWANHMIRELELSVPLPPGRGGGLEVESIPNGPWFNQQCLCNEASIKQTKRMGSFGDGEHMEIWGDRGEGVEAPSLFPHTLPLHLFHVAVPAFHPFIINW